MLAKVPCLLTLFLHTCRAFAAVTNISQVDDRVTVTTANNTELTADYVIVTVPLGVLKRESIGFEPPLSEDKQVAIRDMVSWLLTESGSTWPKLVQPGPIWSTLTQSGPAWPSYLPKLVARLTRVLPLVAPRSNLSGC
jgi:hypothetical protein